MKVRSYQLGGVYYTPVNRPEMDFGSGTATSTSQSPKKDDLIQKEIIGVLKENGLPSDVDYFLGAANEFLQKSQAAGRFFASGNSSYTMSDLIRIQSLANRVKHNHALHEDASQKLVQEGAGSEVAITNNGSLYIYDSDSSKVKTISVNAYHKNSDKYQLLTNADLMHLREEQPDLAYNSSILNDLKDVVGMKSIVDYVKSTIGAFGREGTKTSSAERFTQKQRGQIERGFEQLLGLAPDGYYKITNSQSQTDQGYSDQESLNAAINYLYRTLPNNMKNVLKANAAAEGLDPSEPKDVQRLLAMAVMEHTDHSREYSTDVSHVKDLPTRTGGGSGENSGSATKMTFGPSVQRNMGEVSANGWVLPGGNVRFDLPTYKYDLRNTNNEAVDNITKASENLKIFRDWGLVDTHATAYFGGIPLRDIAANGEEILIDNTKGVGVTYLPVDNNGNLDLQMMSIMTEIQEGIIHDRVTDDAELRERWESQGFTYDPRIKLGVPNGMTLKRFALQTAYAASNGLIDRKDLRDEIFISRVDDEV